MKRIFITSLLASFLLSGCMWMYHDRDDMGPGHRGGMMGSRNAPRNDDASCQDPDKRKPGDPPCSR